MSDKDITNKVKVGSVDEDMLPLEKCVCGHEFGHWSFVLERGRSNYKECPECHRKLYFTVVITVYSRE